MSTNGPEDDRGAVERATDAAGEAWERIGEATEAGADLLMPDADDVDENMRIGVATPAGGFGPLSRVGAQAMAGSGLVSRLGRLATGAGRLAWPSRGTKLARTRRAGAAFGGTLAAGHLYGDMSTASRDSGGDGGIGDIVSGHREDGGATPQPMPQQTPTDPLADPDVAQNDEVAQSQFGDQVEREVASELQQQIEQTSDPDGGVVVGFEGIPRRDATPITETPEEAAGHILDADEESLLRYQQKLYASGFYSVPFEEIRWGFAGPETQEAALGFMQFAAGYRDEGEPVVWHRALDRITDESGGFEEPEDPSEPREPVSLSDPENVGQLADQLYGQIAGRRASDEEKRAAVAMIHRLQREQHQQLWDARVEEIAGAEVEQVDPAAQIAAQVEETAPEDVMDVDVRRAAGGFRGTIGGR